MTEVKNISKSYDGRVIFENLSLKINDGEHCIFTGPSGCGKTTLMRIIAGLEKPDSGEIIMPPGIKKTMVFQENRLFPMRTVLDNILAVNPDRERALYFLKRALLSDFSDKKAGSLSGGMKRRLAIVRALAYGGDIYFFDEPLRELDRKTAEIISELIRDETKDKTSVMITHDSSFGDMLSDRILCFGDENMKIISDSSI